LTLLLESFIDKIAPQLPNISEFMLMRTQDSNEDTALEACEFWLAFAENPQICKEILAPILPKLLPVLIKCMRYSESDVMLLKAYHFHLTANFNSIFLYREMWKMTRMCPIGSRTLSPASTGRGPRALASRAGVMKLPKLRADYRASSKAAMPATTRMRNRTTTPAPNGI
jgi:hypothetical protein